MGRVVVMCLRQVVQGVVECVCGKKQLVVFVVGFFFLQFSISLFAVQSVADWTVLNIIQADNNLSRFANFNLKKMQQVGTSKKINLLVQMDEPIHHTVWRYKVEKDKLVDDGSFHGDMGVRPDREVIEAARWAFTKYPAKYYMLLLWNHGSGILDEKRSFSRGILYDYSSHTCLNNQQFANALETIKREILGRNIDILGMDACLMANLEVAYQLRNYVNIIVASENIERPPGWFYSHILQKLNSTPYVFNPNLLAQCIVHSFGLFCRHRTNIYTQSAIKVSCIEDVKKGVDNFLSAVDVCKKNDVAKTKDLIVKARQKAVEFDKGNFIDLYSFYIMVLKEIKSLDDKKFQCSQEVERLKEVLNDSRDKLKQAIFANTVGKSYARAKGLSIYYPKKSIHSSYYKTKFVADTKWLKFLERYRV